MQILDKIQNQSLKDVPLSAKEINILHRLYKCGRKKDRRILKVMSMRRPSLSTYTIYYIAHEYYRFTFSANFHFPPQGINLEYIKSLTDKNLIITKSEIVTINGQIFKGSHICNPHKLKNFKELNEIRIQIALGTMNTGKDRDNGQT